MKSFLLLCLTGIGIFVTPSVAADDPAPPAATKTEPRIFVKVFGCVPRPGVYELPRGGTLLDALAAAGGWFRNVDLSRVAILRGRAGEKPQAQRHEVRAILTGDAINPRIEEGDAVFVPERHQDDKMFVAAGGAAADPTPPAAAKKEPRIAVKVLGHVEKPGVYELPRGSTTLDAIAAAGGGTRLANLSRVTILRGRADEKPQVQRHDVRPTLEGAAVNPRIEEGDAVFVPERIL